MEVTGCLVGLVNHCIGFDLQSSEMGCHWRSAQKRET